ncbi:hypothetical protein [Streptomyces sporangiiformans]|uniref:Uncharacterized protein n=1 Tax=Streptomyces sporangiiformans TaxID=2315329 RepID=A0A505D7Q4_9ACTN|nr:hypothetical protein [Streptomyces sporangiiformans]TPQ18640.1 hypothetical protein FGD71_030280 [Streptomyces sporangiiformans]
MEIGDLPGWAALAVSIVSVIISYRLGVRSARASEQSAQASQVSAREARRSSDAAERSASAAEGSLALQRQEAEERQRAAEPQVELRVERTGGGSRLRLRNVGGAVATRVTIHDAPGISTQDRAFNFRAGISNVELAPGEAREFLIYRTGSPRMPTHLWVTWQGQEERVALAVPA